MNTPDILFVLASICLVVVGFGVFTHWFIPFWTRRVIHKRRQAGLCVHCGAPVAEGICTRVCQP